MIGLQGPTSTQDHIDHPRLVSMFHACRLTSSLIVMVTSILASVRPPSISSLSISEPYPHIAHSKRVVELFDELRVPWGVQFRIACLVCDGQITWDQVTREILQSLTGTNMDAGPKMRTVFRPLLKGLGGRVMGTTPDADIALFRELDLEDEALEEGSNRNLGLNGEDDEAMGTWWAGHVEQRGILEEYRPPGGTRRLRIRLVHQRYFATSNRFLRKLGSRRFLKVSMKFEAKTRKDEAELEEFLLKGHVINGRVFRVFCGQDIDSPIYLIETDENIDRRAVEEMGDSQRVSLTQFLAWHNPWAWNKTQRMSKWTARFALGLSTSEPAGIFKAQNIHVIRDIESPYRDHTRPIQNKEIMTDGCGLINAAALRMIQKNQRLESVPCAVQGRVAGAKGLWLLDINDQSEEPTIWLTDSQVKIKYENLDRLINDPALRIFDLLRISQTKYPANIGAQPIINLSHNGVPTEVFSTMLQEALRDKVDTLLNFWRRGTEQDLALLWDRIFGLGGLSRLKRARVGGNSEGPQDFGIASHMRKKAKEKAATKEDDEDEGKKDIDEWSGCPSDLYEVAFEMIQAGFHPRNSTYLGVKIRQILKQELERMLSKLRIPVRYSAEVFAVPDFWGVLEEGEVYFRSSKDIEFPDPTKIGSVVEGPVVIFRYPVRLPTDAQKFTAVNHRALHHLKDVVVFSTKGRRSGPSILAGGDCDGDMMVVIWDPRIVDPFENSDVDKFADPPSDFKEKFLTDGGEKVDKFLERLKQEFPTQGPGELDYVRGPLAETQKYLLGGCKKRSNVGQYSIWADTIGYINGERE
ncbi:hypothetical protein FRC03_004716 [Tulasnella sp. 419]|nr:hypothetical protein FRC03_004716 [Tulasnella sp. 419]